MLKVGSIISNTNEKWNNCMCFTSCEVKKTCFSSESIIEDDEKIKKLFFTSSSGKRDYIEILKISELNFIFFRFTSIKVEYTSDIS